MVVRVIAFAAFACTVSQLHAQSREWPAYGGPVVTARGLVFIGATCFDKKLRAFDKATGALLWETTLPYSAIGTPASYQAAGRQFIVVPSGGGKDRGPTGGLYVAFALPKADALTRK